MFGRIRTGWRIFAAGRPGLRFRERYRLHRSRRRGGFGFSGFLHVSGGATLVLLSAFFGWLPVLGWGTAILGLSMIAGEFYPVARLMDWLEVRARLFVRSSIWAQLSVSLLIAVSTFTLMYGLYSLTFG